MATGPEVITPVTHLNVFRQGELCSDELLQVLDPQASRTVEVALVLGKLVVREREGEGGGVRGRVEVRE